MNLALSITAGALVVVFALSGLMKLAVSKDKLVASSNMGWAAALLGGRSHWTKLAITSGDLRLLWARWCRFGRPTVPGIPAPA